MTERKVHSKRYVLSLMPEVFSHLEELAQTQTDSTGQHIAVATLIRNAIHEVYPLVPSTKNEESK
jgi:hypothetical protein